MHFIPYMAAPRRMFMIPFSWKYNAKGVMKSAEMNAAAYMHATFLKLNWTPYFLMATLRL